jgi:hypothetical protein
MSRRNSRDELLRAFLDTYRLNLLAVPRQGAEVGDTYVDTPSGVTAPGNLKHLLEPTITMPTLNRDEEMSGIQGKQTAAIELKAGLKLLEGFFSAIGAAGAVGNIKTAYEHKQTSAVRFKLLKPKRDWVDTLAFGKALIDCRLNAKHPFVHPDNRYYVATAVVRSTSITVSAEDNNTNDINLEATALQGAIGPDIKLGVKRESSGEMTYDGEVPLAFGVELLEMIFDQNEQKFYLKGLTDPQVIRDDEVIRKNLDESRAFIGDANRGDVFINVLPTPIS